MLLNMSNFLSRQNILNSLIIVIAFLAITTIAMIIEPQSFYKYFSSNQLTYYPLPELPHSSYYWDVEHYANLSLNPQCSAFYPLFPLLIRYLFTPANVDKSAYFMRLISLVIFVISIPIFSYISIKITESKKLSLLISLLFFISPLAIFRVIGYTESLFSLLSIILILLCQNQKINHYLKLILISIIVIFMSLSRPILIQILFTTITSLITIIIINYFLNKKEYSKNMTILYRKITKELSTTIAIIIGAILGYAIYGNYCYQTRGDFFAPFHDQSLWGKKLGLHLDLLLFPKSPLVDLWGLYFPIILFFVTLCLIYILHKKTINIWQPQSLWWSFLWIYPPLITVVYLIKNYLFLQKKNNTFFKNESIIKLQLNYSFWFCLYFCIIHCIIIFFTQDRLHSLGRYIFAIPFFYISLAYLVTLFVNHKINKLLLFFIGISGLMLIEQWIRYGKNLWLG